MLRMSKLIEYAVSAAIIVMFLGPLISPLIPLAIIAGVGASMFPEIRYLDLGVCVSKFIVPINIGDIVVYRNEARFIVHRVVSVGSGYYVTKGDMSMYADGEIPESNVICKVVAVLPAELWLSLVTGLLAIYCVYELLKHWGRGVGERNALATAIAVLLLSVAIIASRTVVGGIQQIVPPVAVAPLPSITSLLPIEDGGIEFALDYNNVPGHIEGCYVVTEDGRVENITYTFSSNLVVIDGEQLRNVCGSGNCTVVLLYRLDVPYNVVTEFRMLYSYCRIEVDSMVISCG